MRGSPDIGLASNDAASNRKRGLTLCQAPLLWLPMVNAIRTSLGREARVTTDPERA